MLISRALFFLQSDDEKYFLSTQSKRPKTAQSDSQVESFLFKNNFGLCRSRTAEKFIFEIERGRRKKERKRGWLWPRSRSYPKYWVKEDPGEGISFQLRVLSRLLWFPAFKFRASNKPESVNFTPRAIIQSMVKEEMRRAYPDEEVVGGKDQFGRYYSLSNRSLFEDRVDTSMLTQIGFDWCRSSMLIEHRLRDDY